MSPVRFTAAAVAKVRQRAPGAEIDSGQLRIVADGAAIDLTNAYERYVAEPDRLEDVLAGIAELVASRAASLSGLPDSETLETLTPYLLPRVQSAAWLAEAGSTADPPVAGWLAEGLVVCYVVDRPETSYVTFLTESTAERLDTSLADLHEIAVANLMERSDAIRARFEQRAGRSAIVELASEDDFAATRVLLGTVLRNLCDPFRGPLLVGLPHRDRLMLFDGADSELAREAAETVSKEFAASARGLSPRLFRLEDQDLLPWAPDA
ncbi:MAG: DUF1444 family protein [Chloroflexi bacterium]|nr:DUF1444 family protein [Chloroflexota bacterium]